MGLLKPLGMVKTIVEAAGMGISYAYDDLVFLEHNSFLLQFTGNDHEITVHVNSEADEAAVHGDRNAAYQALLTHPLGPSADRVQAVLDDMLETNEQWLPQFFK